jgi:cytochrome c
MLEYGSGWFTANDDARLIRIEYNGGNRKPQIQMVANQTAGAVPFNLKLSSKGTVDADGDVLNYTWKITSKTGFNKVINTSDANLILTKIGTYNVNLTVSDGKGGINTQAMEVTVGNEPPVLSLEMPKSNKSFYVPNKSFAYEIKVKDKEDGTLDKGINPERVAVNIDYLEEGFDKNMIAMGHRSADAIASFSTGKRLIEANDCMACHKKDTKSIGPNYREVSLKYKNDNSSLETLTKKIIAGGSGVWGDVAMAGHPQLSTADASEMVKYILNISNEKPKEKSLPIKAVYKAKLPKSDKGKGVYIVRAAYEDQGANGISPLKSEQTFVLRNAKVDAHGFDEYVDIVKLVFGGNNLAVPTKSGAYMAIKQVDLGGLSELVVSAIAVKPQLGAVGGMIELHLGSPIGQLLGTSKFLEASEKMDISPKVVSVPINLTGVATDKLQDIYAVFINPTVKIGPIMAVMGLEFKMSSADLGEAVNDIKTEAISPDFYVGKWLTTVIGTPGGDAVMDIDLVRKDGKLTGTVTPKMKDLKEGKLDKVEEKDDKITLYFKMANYDVNVVLEKEDNDNLKGKMMGMFDVKGSRAK